MKRRSRRSQAKAEGFVTIDYAHMECVPMPGEPAPDFNPAADHLRSRMLKGKAFIWRNIKV